MIKIELTWSDKTLEFWSGNNFGRHIYKEQVAPTIDPLRNDQLDHIELIFPKQIIFLNFSFVQGFFSELLPKIGGISNFKKKIKITSVNAEYSERIEKMVWEKLRVR